MAEQETTQTQNTETKPTPGKIVSAGPAIGGTPKFASEIAPSAEEKKADEKTDEKKVDSPPAPTDIDDEKMKAYLESKGITGFSNLEELKAKVEQGSAPPPPKELTEEEKAAREKENDKRALDLFLKSGGTVENFVALKELASSDLTELSVRELKREMKEAGFEEDEIDLMVKERYYQINPDELEKIEGESEEDFNKRKDSYRKKHAYGAKRLAKVGEPYKKQAEEILKGLKSVLEAEDLQEKQEAELASMVDAFAASVPRKLTLELGEHDSKKLDPVPYEVSEADVQKVTAFLKDPVQRKQFLFNQDGSLNLKNIGEALLVKEYLNSALKASFLAGSDNQVAEFEKIFPGRKASDIGIGGNKGGGGAKAQPGKITSAGPVERANPNHK